MSDILRNVFSVVAATVKKGIKCFVDIILFIDTFILYRNDGKVDWSPGPLNLYTIMLNVYTIILNVYKIMLNVYTIRFFFVFAYYCFTLATKYVNNYILYLY